MSSALLFRSRLSFCLATAVAAVLTAAASAQTPAGPSFTGEQAGRGKAVYGGSCAMCHGDNLNDGGFGPPLKGEPFLMNWRGKTTDALLTNVETTMPPGQAGALGDGAYTDVVAFILQANGAAPGKKPLTSDHAALKTATLFAR